MPACPAPSSPPVTTWWSPPGAQQALDLVARVLVEPGDVVAVEDPGYAAARRLFATHRARRAAACRSTARGSSSTPCPDAARLVYVTPSHQFPTGVTMSMARRIALLELGRPARRGHRRGRLRQRVPLRRPAARAAAEPRPRRPGRLRRVLLQVAAPGPAGRLRHRARRRCSRRCARRKRVTVWDGDAATQGALADFLAEGHHAAHVKRATKVYRARRDALLDGLDGSRRSRRLARGHPLGGRSALCTLLRDPGLDDVDDRRGGPGRRASSSSRCRSGTSSSHPATGSPSVSGGIPLEGVGPALATLRGVFSSSRPGRPADG